jgi:Tat protein secretion system quality control protein TatD with DNase activity
MCVDQTEELPLDDEEKPSYRTSDIIADLLSTLPSLPPDLHRRLNDAHCHPTDVPSSVSRIDPSRGGSLCAMSTRPNDQDLVSSFSNDNTDTVIPFFGYHPWFAHLFSVDENHYRSILKPTPPDDFVSHLPKPTLWEEILFDLRKRLESNPSAHVGEIGMDKSFRLPTHSDGKQDILARKDLSLYRTSTEHQLRIFTDQLKLAGEFERAVSVHSVQCHGLIFTALQSLWKGNEKGKKSRGRLEKESNITTEAGIMTFPPRVCIHSASLPLDTLKQYLQPSVPSKVYFSFSTVINARYGQKLLDLISAVPDDRILIESDWHCEGDDRRYQVHDIARVVIHTKKWGSEQGIGILERNFRAFIFGID